MDDDTIAFKGDPALAMRCFFAMRNHGILPAAGGLLDQPADLMDDISMIAAMFNEAYEAAQGKQQEQSLIDDETGNTIQLDMF